MRKISKLLREVKIRTHSKRYELKLLVGLTFNVVRLVKKQFSFFFEETKKHRNRSFHSKFGIKLEKSIFAISGNLT